MNEAQRRHSEISEHLLRIRELPGEERERALAAIADELVRSEVRSLLQHDATWRPDPEATTAPDRPQFLEAPLPDRIGPYRIERRLGRGGFGEVFLAEQREPVKRRVAIKVVPHAATSPELAARFEVERRALEETDHPGIARLLDVGRTAEGLPYLVMEFIDGVPLTQHCEERALPVAARLRLVIAIAEAIQHAHQRGVVHRDLKPANLLVSERDGKSVPHVLDFGIAKPVAGTFVGQYPATAGHPIGTPSYMAPEQTRPSPTDVRTDVYGLGAILHELLTGKPPIDASGGDLPEIFRRIREDVPPPPSSRKLAALRIAPPLLRDLDAIVGHALEKSPSRRYASAQALAADLEAALRSEPIAAESPSQWDLVRRFVRRHRLLVASIVALVVALGIGVVGLALGLKEAERQRREALNQQAAQRRINAFLTEDLLRIASPENLGSEGNLKQMLLRASALVEERLADWPEVAGAIHHTLGDLFAELGEFEKADHHLKQALARRLPAHGRDSVEVVHSQIAMASLLVRQQKSKEAEAALGELIPRARRVVGHSDPVLYDAINALGSVQEVLGQAPMAIASFEEALSGYRRLLPESDVRLFGVLSNLALVLDGQGQAEAALRMLQEALAVGTRSKDTPKSALFILNNNVGATLQDLGKKKEAEPYLRRAAELAESLLGADDFNTLTIKANLASLDADFGRAAEAAKVFEDIIARRTRLLGGVAHDTLEAKYGYFTCVRKAGEIDRAREGFESLLRELEQHLGETHVLTAKATSALAHAQRDAGRRDEAIKTAERAVERLAAAFPGGGAWVEGAKALVDELGAPAR